MRATITKNITVDENPAYASEGDVDIIDGHAVLTSEELTDFVNAAMAICGDDSGLSIVIDDALLNSVMTTDDLKAKVLLSSVMTNIIGSLLFNQTGYGKTISAINLGTALVESIKVIEFE